MTQTLERTHFPDDLPSTPLETAMATLDADMSWAFGLRETLADSFGQTTEHDTTTPEDVEGMRRCFDDAVADLRTATYDQTLSVVGRDKLLNGVGRRLELVNAFRAALLLQGSGVALKAPTLTERARVSAVDALYTHVTELTANDADTDDTDLAVAMAHVLDEDNRPLEAIVEATAQNIYAAIVGDSNASMGSAEQGGHHYGRHHLYLQAFLQGTAYFYLLYGRPDAAV